MKKLLIVLCGLTLALPAAVAVAETDCAQDVRPAVTTLFQQGQQAGQSLEEMVAKALDLGPNLCGVLVVASELGYGQEEVLNALVAAQVAPAVIARAAIDAGYDLGLVGKVVGNDQPADVVFVPTADIPTPTLVGGSGRTSSSVSPSKVQ